MIKSPLHNCFVISNAEEELVTQLLSIKMVKNAIKNICLYITTWNVITSSNHDMQSFYVHNTFDLWRSSNINLQRLQLNETLKLLSDLVGKLNHSKFKSQKIVKYERI